MNDKTDYVMKKIHRILEELKKQKYNISNDRLLQMLENIKNTNIFIHDDSITELYTFSRDNKKFKYNIDKTQGSCVLEFQPLFENGEFIPINPILYLIDFKNKDVFDSTLYHEICHLLAIGPWVPISNNTINHISGTLETSYIYGSDVISKKREWGISNEQINDFIAKKLYEIIEQKEYVSNRKAKNSKSSFLDEDISIEDIIGFYFSNDLENLSKILLTKLTLDLRNTNSLNSENICEK